jgi:predicted RNA binding protein YcfA (HicA-like mRNA interferase family)
LPINRKELIRRLRKLGFTELKSGGKHPILFKGKLRIAIPNPHHSNEVDESLLSRILRQAGVSRKDFDNIKD